MKVLMRVRSEILWMSYEWKICRSGSLRPKSRKLALSGGDAFLSTFRLLRHYNVGQFHSLLPHIQIIFPQPPIKCRWRDAEQFSGFAAVPASFFQGSDDLLAFDVAKVV